MKQIGSRLKNEVGKNYGPWQVVELLVDRYVKNGCAQFKVTCRHCGYSKICIGNNLRFDHFAHQCNICKGV